MEPKAAVSLQKEDLQFEWTESFLIEPTPQPDEQAKAEDQLLRLKLLVNATFNQYSIEQAVKLCVSVSMCVGNGEIKLNLKILTLFNGNLNLHVRAGRCRQCRLHESLKGLYLLENLKISFKNCNYFLRTH